MEFEQIKHIKSALEALLFVGEKPVTLKELKDVFPECSTGDLKKIIDELKNELDEQQRGLVIEEIAEGYQMLTRAAYAPYVRDFLKTVTKEKLSRAALETLAIVAYKQPVTRTDIELIRGVNSDGVVSQLLNKGLLGIAGRKEVPGRPFMYGTNKQFLEFFGLKSLDDLPKLEDFALLNRTEDVDGSYEQSSNVLEGEYLKEQSIEENSNQGADAGVEEMENIELQQKILNGDVQNIMLNEIDEMLDAADEFAGEVAVDDEVGDNEVQSANGSHTNRIETELNNNV